MTPGTLAVWIGFAFALATVGAAVAAHRDDGKSLIASRCLAMAAAFTTLAAGLLLSALHRGDLSTAFVARHITLSLPAVSRWLAAFSDASGAGLVAASWVGLVATWLVRSGKSPEVAGTAAVTMLVLLAAPLAGGPLRHLPWLPVDGLGVSPLFRHGLSGIYVAGMLGMVASAVVALGRSLESWRTGAGAARAGRVAALALLSAGWQAMAHQRAAVATGVSSEPSLTLARGGGWMLAIVVAASGWLIVRSESATTEARTEAGLAVLLVAIGLVLAAGEATAIPVAVRGLWLLAVTVLGIAAWRARAARRAGSRARPVAGTLPWPAARALLLGALAAACLAALMSGFSRRDTLSLPSGGTVTTALPGRLTHQGVSRYDESDATVLALALELQAPGIVRLASAEHREFHDVRGSVIGELVRRPAVFVHALGVTVVWLSVVGDNDRVQVEVLTIPLQWLWWLALGLLTVALLLPFIESLTDRGIPASPSAVTRH
ncbi:MAG: hypothetical protein ACT4P7_17130 [Gemmatimonadaceae bacterium]